MNYRELDTPALLIDREILINNLDSMQKYADENHVRLRPHTKTHKSPFLADMQVSRGALGIAAAKVGEAEVMAENGFSDIFIANEIVGKKKLERVASLSQKIQISFGVDCAEYIPQIEQVFTESNSTANILVEIEVGENRSGVIHEEDFVSILQAVSRQPHVEFRGIFSHDGNSYAAGSNAHTDESCPNPGGHHRTSARHLCPDGRLSGKRCGDTGLLRCHGSCNRHQ